MWRQTVEVVDDITTSNGALKFRSRCVAIDDRKAEQWREESIMIENNTPDDCRVKLCRLVLRLPWCPSKDDGGHRRRSSGVGRRATRHPH